MIDYHLHGNFCGHATGDLEEYVRVALEKGFLEIGFSAHLPKVKDPDPYHAMPEEDLPRYVELVEGLRTSYRDRLTIKLGIEADYFVGYDENIRSILSSYPFDYVFGSIHFLGDWHFTSRAGLGRYKTENPDQAFSDYFDLLGRMIESGLFDIVAHPDAIRREGFAPSEPPIGLYRRTADLLRRHSMSVEINTAGIRRRAGSVYPDRAFLEACLENGVSVTLGSDAHSPGDVGKDYAEAFRILSELEITEIATYDRRRKMMRLVSDFIREGV